VNSTIQENIKLSGKLGLFSATSIVVANIIGTGIFTTTGFLAAGIPSHFGLLFIWLIGGLLALSGALTYGELASAMPRSGGEYHYLSVLYHPALGFMSGFISLVAGFAAPVAASALAFGTYLSVVLPGIAPVWAAAVIVLLMTGLHSLALHYGARVQNVFTVVKVLLIVGFILAGLTVEQNHLQQLIPTATDWDAVLSTGFAVGLIYVSFSYSGWNAAAYIAGEVNNARRNVPLALLLGTLIVMTLYLLLNFVFIYSAPLSAFAGKAEVGDVAARHIFGDVGGNVVSILIALALVSSVSSMTMAGPRVMMAIGEDLPAMRILASKNKHGVPHIALFTQGAIALLIVFVSQLQKVIGFIGFTLSIFALLTVVGIFIHRSRNSNSSGEYKTWGYPITPLLFALLSLWMVYNTISSAIRQNQWEIVGGGFGTMLLGLVLYYVLRRVKQLG